MDEETNETKIEKKSEVTRQEEEAKSPSPELGYVENDPIPVDSDPVPVDSDPVPVDSDPVPVESDPVAIESDPVPVDSDPVDPNDETVVDPRDSDESSLPSLKRGFIDIQGKLAANNWINRYFVLELGKLTYYEKPSDEPPYGISEKGSIPSLKGKKVIDNGNMVALEGGKEREIKLKFDSEESKKQWSKAFERHIAYADALE